MALFGDYHTHTPYSHGKGTIAENVQSAINKGLRQVAITDHGFSHALYAMKREDIVSMRKEIEEAEDRAPIDVLLGVEANLISYDGDVDILPEDYDKFDIILCGYHQFAKPKKKFGWLSFHVKNLIGNKIHFNTKRQIKKNTNAYVQAMRKYDIDVITHLGRGLKVDVRTVARVAKETNTYIELNSKNLGMSEKEIKICMEEGVKFIIDSDAHTAERVGECSLGLKTMLKLKIPEDMVVNYNKIPTFKKERRKSKSNA